MKKVLIFLMCFSVVMLQIITFGLRQGTVYAESDMDDFEELEDDEAVELPKLFIKAINPGYTVDGKSNVGEMIEIARIGSDAPISLAGITVSYTNSSGNTSTLVEFSEYSYMTGENILLRLASSPNSELASVNYTKTLAYKAGIALKIGDEVVDEICWTGKDGCYKDFKSSNPTTLVRNIKTGLFEHLVEYEPEYVEGNYYVESKKEEEGYGKVPSQCKGLVFSEILSYYETSRSEQFIELYNNRAEQINMNGCKIKYKNKVYVLEGTISPEEYYVYYPKGFNLTKNPVNSNTLELIDTDDEVIDALKYYNGQRKGTSYAFIGYDNNGEEIWRVTYAPTPGAPNNYQEYKACEAGKVINKATGNCVKVASVKDKICPNGQYLNVLTGRCRKYKTEKEKTCKEGYYLNPETGRCKKIVENKGADYSLKPEEYEEKSSFVAIYAIIGVVLLGLVYLIYEFRHEILKLFRRVFRRFR